MESNTTRTVLVFGDQTDDVRSVLRALLVMEPDPILQSFLQRSYGAIRAELLRLSKPEDGSASRFSSLKELIDVNLHGSHRVALDHALTTLCHFGLLFERCRQSQGLYPDIGSTYLMGICTGSLAAAAASFCRTPLDLLPLAIDVCVLAFRAGELAADVAARFYSGPSQSVLSWALALPNLDLEGARRIIEEFIRLKKTPVLSRPFISVVSDRSLTITGPPDVLSEIRHSSSLGGSGALPLYAPYHAPHLYCKADIGRILDKFMEGQHGHRTQLISLVTSDGKGVKAGTTMEKVFCRALENVFLEPLIYTQMIDTLKNALQMSHVENINIVPMACNACQSITRALGSAVFTPVKLMDSILPPLGYLDSKKTCCQTSQSKIAIVGMSGRFPGAENLEEFWNVLQQGLDVHKVVPLSRWNAESHVDVSQTPRKNTSATPYGCWLDKPGLFDAKFFGMSPREAEQTDPAQRLALMTAYEALEDGGLVPGMGSMRKDRVGVCFGVTSNDWMETNSSQNIDTYMISGGNRAFIPGRINYFFKFSGPSLVIDTACSSSLAAIHTACNILWRGEADTMITGGTNVLTNPDFTAGLDRGRFLSRTGNCKTFDDKADGYCRGEGVGTIILKRLEDAVLDRDPIKGVIVNICTNHSAEAESITRPNLWAQKEIVTNVLDGLSPSHVSYVEMHGTGTQVGDTTEITSILESIAPSSGSHSRSNAHVHIGSAKANVGHGEAAAGVTSLVKLLLMMQQNTIPPHIGIKSMINRKFPKDLADRGVCITTKPIRWNRAGSKPRYALLNNFSAAGGNTTLLLQDAPDRGTVYESDPRSVLPVVLSAKTSSALYANAKALLKFIAENPHLEISGISYTTTARRSHHAHRIAVKGSSPADIAGAICTALDMEIGKTRSLERSIVFAFSGQGGHYLGMGKDLYHNVSSFASNINRYNQMALDQGFSQFLPLIKDSEGDLACFTSEAVQIAIISLELALIRLWASWGVSPSVVIGHSLGHYAALTAAGVLSEADTIFLVGTRARKLQERCQLGSHSMLDVRASESAVQSFIYGSSVEIACVNGPQNVILGGTKSAIEGLHSQLAAKKITCRILNLPYAFHSSQVDCVLEDLEESACGVKFHSPRIPVLCPRTEQVIITDGVAGPAHLVDHYRNRVNLVAALEAGKKSQLVRDYSVFLEIGHTSAVASMIKASLGSGHRALPSLRRGYDTWALLAEALGALFMQGFDIRWDEYHRDFAKSVHHVSIPHYQWDLNEYWITYKNDWSLYKGEPTRIIDTAPGLISTTIHSVVTEDMTCDPGTIILRSDLNASGLRAIAQGHKVHGIPLCTPSIYADIALTVGRYVQKKWSATEERHISIDNMTIEKALITQSTSSRWLQTEVVTDSEGGLKCRFATVNEDHEILINHATCTVKYSELPTMKWKQEQALKSLADIRRLRERLADGQCDRFNSHMIYRMIATLADFDRGYRGLKEIVLDSKAMAAASKVDLGALERREDEDAIYSAHPAYVDSFSQSAGFVMNANERSDLEVECFVNHGWKSFQLYETLKADGDYESYVQMKSNGGSVWEGTLTVVKGNRVVAMFEGITLQGIPRRLLHSVLSSASKLQSKQKQALEETLLVDPNEQSRSQIPRMLHNQDEAAIDSSLSRIIDIVAEESGIERLDLGDDTDFVSVGIDSLMSLIITSRLKDDLSFDIGPSLSIFDTYSTVGQLKSGYLKSLRTSHDTNDSNEIKIEAPTKKSGWAADKSWVSSSPMAPSDRLSKPNSVSQDTAPSSPQSQPETIGPSTSVVLQRAKSPNESTTIFLFPDGSGSPMSYAALPPVSPNLTIIALICPYHRDPEGMMTHCTFEGLMASYIAEVRRLNQPTSAPYSLGGWSSGGILAYRAAQILLDAGETVRNLVLVDSPTPNGGLARLPHQFYEHCSQVGVFGQIRWAGVTAAAEDAATAPHHQWLIPHFTATVELLAGYHAPPLRVPPGTAAPRVAICWAGLPALDGVRYSRYEGDGDGDGEGVQFFTRERTDFGPGAWAELLGPPQSGWWIEGLMEYDHFGIMYGEGAQALASFLRRALAA